MMGHSVNDNNVLEQMFFFELIDKIVPQSIIVVMIKWKFALWQFCHTFYLFVFEKLLKFCEM